VLDTSVLLADPAAISRFAEHRVILPIVVITELEAKRHHPELGYFARQALRHLDDLRIEFGRLDADLPIGDEGGTVRVELNHSDPQVLPPGFRLGDNDTRILSVARSLVAEGEDVVLVSKDLPLRVKAASIGLTAQEYRAELPADSGWTGMTELEVNAENIQELYDTGKLDCEQARELPCHTGLVLGAGGSSRAVLFGLIERGVKRVYLANRTLERARALADQFGARVHPVSWEAIGEWLPRVDLLVNTTSLGMHGQPALEIDVGRLPAHAVVADLVYVPLETPLLAAARARGLKTADGLGMLLHQAVRGFELWFGQRPKVTPELRALVEADLTKL